MPIDPRVMLQALAGAGGQTAPQGPPNGAGGGGILQAIQALMGAGGGASGAPDPRAMAEMPMPRQRMAGLDPRDGYNEIPMALPTEDKLGPDYPEPSRGEMGENNRQMIRDTVNDRMTEGMPSEGGPTRYMDRSDMPPRNNGPTQPSDEEDLDDVRKEMEGAEGGDDDWEGDKKSGPTKNDIKYMKDHPTDGVLEDFEKHFGYAPNVNEGDDEDHSDDGDHEYR